MLMLTELDETLQRLLGMPHLVATRDNSIHDRLDYLADFVREVPDGPSRVLDVGCGSGMALRYLSQYSGLLAPKNIHDHAALSAS